MMKRFNKILLSTVAMLLVVPFFLQHATSLSNMSWDDDRTRKIQVANMQWDGPTYFGRDWGQSQGQGHIHEA